MSENTPLSGLNAVKAIMKEFDSVESYLRAVRDVMDEGHMPDISGLDDRVAKLCDIVQEVSPDIQERCATKLDELLQKLNDCEDEMAVFQDKRQKIAQE